MTMDGVLPVWKPVDYTSHDVVAKVRRIVKLKRIGHTGTLDPMVTGVLPLCLGKATRIVEYIQELPKEYEAVLRIGISTDTEDLTGTIIEHVEQVELSESLIREIMEKFVGTIHQTPPMYSAVKVDGKRLYELARAGQVVERKTREVTIHRIELLDLDMDKPHPEVRFRVLCSKGTYIRTLCVDIGKALGYPSVMANLVRTSTGNISRDRCLTLEQIEALQKAGELEQHLISIDDAIAHLPSTEVLDPYLIRALQGQKLRMYQVSPVTCPDQTIITLYSQARKLIGLFRYDQNDQLVVPIKVFLD